jgi:transposase-like protein
MRTVSQYCPRCEAFTEHVVGLDRPKHSVRGLCTQCEPELIERFKDLAGSESVERPRDVIMAFSRAMESFIRRRGSLHAEEEMLADNPLIMMRMILRLGSLADAMESRNMREVRARALHVGALAMLVYTQTFTAVAAIEP